MRKHLSLLVVGLVCAPVLAHAEDTPTAPAAAAPAAAPAAPPAPDYTLTANVGLTSNYVFRGITQSSGGPAIQGGFDFTHKSGIYLGTWASNVGWIEDYQGYNKGNVEIDVYGGYRNGIGDTGLSYDVGLIQYNYPGDRPAGIPKADTSEVYGSLAWKWFTVKYSYYLSKEVFGFGPPINGSARGTDYLDISASVPFGDTGLTGGAHWGDFRFNGTGNDLQNYKDWKVSLTYDLSKLGAAGNGMTLGVAYTDTDVNSGDGTAFSAPWTDANGKDLGKGTAFVWISKTL